MEIARNILLVVYIIVCIVLILVTTFQAKESENAAEDTYENPSANKYFDKNKSRTKAGKMNKRTLILGVIFAILTVATSIVTYLAA
jgi:protein translocase SecG subunit